MLQPFKLKLAPPPGKKLIRDWNGLTVRTVNVMRNGRTEIPAGLVCQVETHGGTGLTLKGTPCSCCNVAVYISRVSHLDVEVIVDSTTTSDNAGSHPVEATKGAGA